METTVKIYTDANFQAISFIAETPTETHYFVEEQKESSPNRAEYNALIAVLEYANENNWKYLDIYSDSDLMVGQVNKRYRIKNQALQRLYWRVEKLLREVTSWKLTHIEGIKNPADVIGRKRAVGRKLLWKVAKEHSTQLPLNLEAT